MSTTPKVTFQQVAYDGTRTTLSIDTRHPDIQEMLGCFTAFLKALGYHLDGELQVVESEDV